MWALAHTASLQCKIKGGLMIGVTKLLCGVDSSGDELRYRESVHARPVVVWNFTRQCNLHCVHCYAEAQSGASPQELSTQEG